MAHTPGPWRLSRGSVPPYGWRVDGPYLGALAVVHNLAYGVKNFEDGDATEAELEANARLIAAAPDLLEAARGILDGHEAETRGEPGGDWYTLWENLRSAINKAKGAQ